MNFLIVLLAIILLEAYSELGFVQRDNWLRKWHSALHKLGLSSQPSALGLIVFLAVPLLLLYLLLSTLAQQGLGLFVFLLELVVLLYALGRGNLDTQIALLTSDLQRDDLQAAFHDASVFNTAYREGSAESAEDLKEEVMLLTRIGENSYLGITGDVEQSDIDNNGLDNFITLFNEYKKENKIEFLSIQHINLTNDDIMRDDVIKDILNIYNN